jgi:AraC-like DNA-binding protein
MRLMADERIYRHEGLTIGSLATKLSMPEYKLRRLINQELGYRNFNVFLNNHRIEEAKTALADPSQAEVPVKIQPLRSTHARPSPMQRRSRGGRRQLRCNRGTKARRAAATTLLCPRLTPARFAAACDHGLMK